MTTPELETLKTTTIPVHEIAKNPLNPRKKASKAALDELTESVKAFGILQPVLVRPHPKGSHVTPWELVFGERRWLAATRAGFEEIPARIVETLDDEKCVEIMLVENGKRDDLEPLEEAETYFWLKEKCGLTLEEVAARVGKSKTTIFQRVKLLEADPAVRKALAEGALELSVAELLARSVHPTQQKDALASVRGSTYDGPMPYREAKRLFEAEFMLRLAGVPWQLEDPSLLETAGPCTTCPKRTGNQAELFAGDKTKDVCLDRECFEKKTEAFRARKLEAAAAEGAEILEGDAAKKLFDQFGHLKSGSGFVKLDDQAPLAQPGKRRKSIGQVLGKTYRPPVTVVTDPESGAVIELARKADVAKAFDAKGIKTRKLPETGASPEEKERRKKGESEGRDLRRPDRRARREGLRRQGPRASVSSTSRPRPGDRSDDLDRRK